MCAPAALPSCPANPFQRDPESGVSGLFALSIFCVAFDVTGADDRQTDRQLAGAGGRERPLMVAPCYCHQELLDTGQLPSEWSGGCHGFNNWTLPAVAGKGKTVPLDQRSCVVFFVFYFIFIGIGVWFELNFSLLEYTHGG